MAVKDGVKVMLGVRVRLDVRVWLEVRVTVGVNVTVRVKVGGEAGGTNRIAEPSEIEIQLLEYWRPAEPSLFSIPMVAFLPLSSVPPPPLKEAV